MTQDDIETYLKQMAAAYSAGNAQACADLFTQNAQLHSPFAPPAIGRAAIRALHEDWVAHLTEKSFELLDHGGTGDIGWCLCRFSEGDGAEAGTSQLILERQADGTWLARSCCLFGDD